MEKKVVLITGASGGIGKSISTVFWKYGCHCVLQYHQNKINLQEINIYGKNRAVSFHADLRVTSDIDALFYFIQEEYGQLDVLINCAGKTCDSLIVRMGACDWDDVIRLNLTAPWLCIQRATKLIPPSMRQSIINIASLSGITGNKGQSNYAASKAGLIALTKVAASELWSYGVHIHAVVPGLLPTKMAGDRAKEKPYAAIKNAAQFIYTISNMQTTGQIFSIEDRFGSYTTL